MAKDREAGTRDAGAEPRVLVLTPGVFDKGGIARYGRFQVEALREAWGKEAVRVVSLMGRQADDLETPFDVDWSGPSPLGHGSRELFSWTAWRIARGWSPSVVLTQHVNLGLLGWGLARAVGARLVQNIYGLEIWSGLSRARSFALRRADRVISDCHHTAERAVALGLVGDPPAVVWDCVDTGRFAPAPADPAVAERYGVEAGGRFRILLLARLDSQSRYKGTERLLRLLARLPSDEFEAIFAGKGDDIEHLRSLARELAVAERVSFTGSIHEDDLPEAYRWADAFYLASEAGPGKGEGIPLTPLEAMACGVPVIVGDQDGSREALESRGGFRGDPTDLAAQAAYLVRLRQEPGFHRAEREAARNRALAAFSYPSFASRMVAEVGRVAEARGRST